MQLAFWMSVGIYGYGILISSFVFSDLKGPKMSDRAKVVRGLMLAPFWPLVVLWACKDLPVLVARTFKVIGLSFRELYRAYRPVKVKPTKVVLPKAKVHV